MSITELIWTFENGDITVDEFKQDLLSLLLKALPEKKQIDRIKYTVDERRYPTGYNQALQDTEEAIRKVLG